MDEKPIHINEDCWAFVKQMMTEFSNVTLRQLYKEIMVLEMVIAAMKTRPHLTAAIDECLATARRNEGIDQAIDAKIQSVLKIVNTLDQSNRDQVLADLVRLYTQAGKPN